MKREKTDYIVQSVYNALDVLESFKTSGELDIRTLREKFDLSKNNLFRLLATLEKHGYVERNPYTKNYRLGLKNFELSQAYINKIDLLRTTEPILQELVNTLNESAYIGVLRGKNVVYLNVIETTQFVRIIPRIGSVGSPFCTAIGKCQLFDLNGEEIRKQISDAKIQTSCSGTPFKGIDAFVEEIEMSRPRGYTIDDEEFEMGVRCVGAPLRNYTGKIVAGMSVSGPVQRMSYERIENEIGPALIEKAHKASKRMGYSELVQSELEAASS
ncbi:IclR family transcriptional regulator [Desulfurispirillum indicum]|uniref:Regulatory protein IclR n=1 Tax=Desulfurispirillum indicum (strain ATCC BAA-1389 / DSM 22839 / S5) TaxID=653733 RepID=E6W6P8_DESIS|nr:IclR family transcriptional regulator [Desulfurispirillum indicum]ADU65048.1 regulatory protein IclR [Desulfurispirillum indicum S5]UCZ56956.1 IclR family transcriptional regulator [Desulfurispirillum indicum]